MVQRDMLSKLLVILVKDHYGDMLASVASAILDMETGTLGQIVSRSGLGVKSVRSCLAVLIRQRLVKYRKEESSERIFYSIVTENILALMRYPRYLSCISEDHDEVAVLLSEHLIRAGADSLTGTLIGVGRRLIESNTLTKEILPSKVVELQKRFQQLVEQKYFEKVDSGATLPPAFDMKPIVEAILNDEKKTIPEDATEFCINTSKMMKILRDKMIVDAAIRRVDKEAGLVLKSVLDLVSLQPGADAGVSPMVSYNELQRHVSQHVGSDNLACVHLDQYLRTLASDKTRFVDRVGDTGGGQYQVDMRHVVTCLVEATCEAIIQERFSSKAARVFRYVRTKKYVEENDLHGNAMIPSKEAKTITYELLENSYIQLQELRKTISASAPSKSVYLYYVDMGGLARTQLTRVYQALINIVTRRQIETQDNARLLEKQERIEAITASLRAEGGTEEQLKEVSEMMAPPEHEAVTKVHKNINHLSDALLQASDTMMLLRLYLDLKIK